jgi:hypothetical protein
LSVQLMTAVAATHPTAPKLQKVLEMSVSVALARVQRVRAMTQ